MPAFPLSPEVAREAFEAWQRFGSKAEAARALGIPVETLKSRVNKHKEYQANDPAINASMQAVGTNLIPKLAWAKTKGDDGTSYSVLLKPDPLPDDTLDRIRQAFEGMKPAEPIAPPEYADSDLATIIPIADAHVGLRAWGRETGSDYNTDIACDRIREWVGRCVAASPSSNQAFIVDVGDLTHANDDTNATPRSKHVLDVDTRHFRTLEMTIAALASAAETALAKFGKVTIVILPGNHNPHAYLAILFALAERYRNEPRITVVKDPGEFWSYKFGKNMLAFHHGDKAKVERLVLYLADEFPEMWGETRFRYLFTGHLHHHKSADVGGVQWEQLRALTEKDAYATSHAYSARAQLQAITLHRTKGEVARVKVSAAA